jgi:acetylornithine deacetylase/succinyl-diaminopimelate desuccinylase-like protein
VPAGEGWRCDPFGAEVKNGRIYGRGSADMKSGLAAMLGATKALIESEVELKGDLVLTAVVDEEMGGSKGTEYLVNHGLIDGHMAIVCEPSDLKLVNAEDGFLCLEITTFGETSHPCIGYGMDAVYEMATLIVKLRERLDQRFKGIRHETVGTPAITCSIIRGGEHIAVVPDSCKAGLYLKLVPGDPSQDPDEARRLVEMIIEELMRNDEKLRVSIRPWPEPIFKAPPFEVPKDLEITKIVREVTRDIVGKYPDFWVADRFARDNFDSAALRAKPYSDMLHLFLKGGIPCVYFGPGKIELSHVVDEYVEIHQIVDACKIYAAVALKVLS